MPWRNYWLKAGWIFDSAVHRNAWLLISLASRREGEFLMASKEWYFRLIKAAGAPASALEFCLG
jgi:hypothetical protein